MLIILFLLVSGCTSKTKEPDLSFWRVKLGFSEKQIINKMGDPTTTTDSKVKELYYKEINGPGAIFSLEKDYLVKAVWYPSSFDSNSTIPSTIENVDFSNKYTTKKQSCYETAQCNVYVFENTSSSLEILMSWENKVIDQVVLSSN
jgi:hypothetical protein